MPDISPADRHKVILAFCYAFSTTGAYVVVRSAADGLFLGRVGSAWLPFMYFLSACTVGPLAIVFLKLAAGRSLKQVVHVVLISLSLTSVILCQLVTNFDSATVLLMGIYLLAEIHGCLNTIQYGMLVNELFVGSPNHHRITGLLSAAATLAGIAFGAIIAFEIHQLRTVHLLYVVAGLDLLALIPISLLPRIETEYDHDGNSQTDAKSAVLGHDVYSPVALGSGLTAAARSPYVRGIGLLVALSVIVGTLIEFQWKTSVATSFAEKEDQMTSFFGLFHAAVNLLTGLIQVLFTGTLLHRFGTRTALLVFPTALLASMLGVLFASAGRIVLSAITLAKGCDVVKRSVNDPAILMLYAPLSNGPRRQAITFVAGIVKPSSEAMAALLIISFAGIVSTQAISYVALALLCFWLLIALRHRTNKMNITTPLSDSITAEGKLP